jgi:uncharacterized membrane protein
MRNIKPRLRDFMDGETVCMLALALTVLISVIYCMVEDYEVKKKERQAAKFVCPLCERTGKP